MHQFLKNILSIKNIRNIIFLFTWWSNSKYNSNSILHIDYYFILFKKINTRVFVPYLETLERLKYAEDQLRIGNRKYGNIPFSNRIII